MFKNREDAGRLLAERLASWKAAAPIVLALPRGGVVVGAEVARALDAPLDIVVVRKLGAPGDQELAIGAVAEGEPPQTVLNEALLSSLEVTPEHLRAEVSRQLREIERRQQAYRGGRVRAELAGRTVLLVDDGIATGATVAAALRSARLSGPAALVLAVPVASSEALRALADEVDETVCLLTPESFTSVGAHYADFDQTPDEHVVRLLESARREK